MLLHDCTWGPEAKSIQSTSVWQKKLADLVIKLEAALPVKTPKFDWKHYAGIVWLGEPVLAGMEKGEATQMPEYSLQYGADWRNKLRFLSCFKQCSGHIMKLWIRLQLLVQRQVNFYDLISNDYAITCFVQCISNESLGLIVTDVMLLRVLQDQVPHKLNPIIRSDEPILHRADRRLNQLQHIDDPKYVPRALSRYMIMLWAVDLLPMDMFDLNRTRNIAQKNYKTSWRSLGTSLTEAADQTHKGWFDTNELPQDLSYQFLYRDSIDVLKQMSNARSSQACAIVHQCYVTTLREWAAAFGKEFNEVEDTICLKGSCRILSLVAQFIARKIKISQNKSLVNEMKSLTQLISDWLESSLI